MLGGVGGRVGGRHRVLELLELGVLLELEQLELARHGRAAGIGALPHELEREVEEEQVLALAVAVHDVALELRYLRDAHRRRAAAVAE